MTPNFITIGYDLWIVAVSYLIASYASFVALDLAKRVRTADRSMVLGWWACGSVAMGSGIWSMHFVGMLAMKVPFSVGYGYTVTALSWLAAVGASAVALHVASLRALGWQRLLPASLAMGGGICTMHYTGMAALEMAPGIDWRLSLVATSAVIAVAASAVALLIFFWLRQLSGLRAQRWKFLAALVMGAAICGMHYTGMAAAQFAVGAVCLSANQLRGDSLGLLVTVAALALLTLAMFTSALDARMQRKTAKLAASLQSATHELQELAFRDALTGLPNRLLFDDRVSTAVDRSARDGASLAVLFVDLDGFKAVNDSFGHRCGDAVLREMASRLAAQARATDTVARVGGDAFVLLLEGNPDATAVARITDRIIEAIGAPMHSDGHDVRLSCSVGIAMYPTDGPRDKLLPHADAAMAAAKRAGGSSYAFFEPHMHADMQEQIELQQDLRRALELGTQLELHYQPKISAQRGVVTGAEALVRWQHPERGLLPPGLFIPVAERFGLICALGDWVIHEACTQIRRWLDQGLRVRVAINLSVHQLRHDGLPERVQQALLKHGVDAGLLTFEITESVAMDDTGDTLRAFNGLAALGAKLSIDDFGTGYSSLAYLRSLPATELKIDRSFVQDVADSADARAIVKAVVQLAHALGLSVVAEGVETAAQCDVLTALECDELQGYLFSKAMKPALLAQWALDKGHAPLGDVWAPTADRALPLRFTESAFMPD